MHLKKYTAEIDLLKTIPGMGDTTASITLAEIGANMNQFPTDMHIASWAGLSPGNNESAGKKKSSQITPGNKNLKASLIQAAWAASSKKGSYWYSKYRKLRFKLGTKRAIIAIARKMLITCYHMLKKKRTYKELGANYVDKKASDRIKKYYVRQLQKLGCNVSIT